MFVYLKDEKCGLKEKIKLLNLGKNKEKRMC